MIFPTVMFWVWMAAQQPLQGRPPLTPDNAGQVISGTPPRASDKGAWKLVLPAEHVIEIRTKRETAKVDENNLSTGCPEGFTTVPSRYVGADVWEHEHCERVTREIWVDGIRYGTLKETDAK